LKFFSKTSIDAITILWKVNRSSNFEDFYRLQLPEARAGISKTSAKRYTLAFFILSYEQ